VGILSEADLLKREELGTEKVRPRWLEAIMPSSALTVDYSKSHGRKVSEVMSEAVVTAKAGAALSEIAALLERKRIKRVPIVEDLRPDLILCNFQLPMGFTGDEIVADIATRLQFKTRHAHANR